MRKLVGRKIFIAYLAAALAGCSSRAAKFGTGGTGGAGETAGSGGGGGVTGASGTGGLAGASGAGGTGGLAGASGAGGTGGSMSCAAHDIDVPSVLVTGTFTINGAAVTDPTVTGTISLFTGGLDSVTLGSASATSYAVRVVPGTYDVIYQAGDNPGATGPQNNAATLGSVTIPETGTTGLAIDVPSVLLAGAITINGAAVTSPADAGKLSLLTASDWVELGSTSAGSYAVRVVPGTYDLYYHPPSGASAVAPGNSAKLGSVVVAATGTTVFDIDIPSVELSGALTINGAISTSLVDSGTVFLASSTGGGISLGSTMAGSYSVRVSPGTYDIGFAHIVYTTPPPGSIAPYNNGARLGSVTVAASGANKLNVDVPSVFVAGTFKFNGATVTAATDWGVVYLEAVDGTNSVLLGQTTAGSYSVPIVPGRYQVVYEAGVGGSAIVPLNNHAKLQTIDIAPKGTTTVDVDVPSVKLSGALTLNGATVTDPADFGDVWLFAEDDTFPRDGLPLGSTSAGSYSVRVVPGRYDIAFGTLAPKGTFAPGNSRATIGSVVVGASDTVLDVDVPSVLVTGSIRIDSMLDDSMADYGNLSLQSREDGVSLGVTSAGSYSARVIPGDYDLYYLVGTAGALAPRNPRIWLRCFSVR